MLLVTDDGTERQVSGDMPPFISDDTIDCKHNDS